MKRILYLLAALFTLDVLAFGQGTAPLVIQEADGSPKKAGVTKIIVSNGTLTISGTTATITTGGGGSGITIGTTTIASGTTTRVLYNNAGVVGEYTITGTGNVAMSASPTFTGTVAAAAATFSGAITQTSASATAFESGPNGSTNPVFRLVNSTASQADGVSVTGLAAGSGTTFTALSSGSNSGLNFAGKGTGGFVFTSGVTTGTGATAGLQGVFNSLTTGNGVDISSTSATSGNLVSIASTSTAAASSTLTGLKIAMSGANGTTAQTVTGASISVTNTNATSGTNIALNLAASGATTANYALQVNNGINWSGTAIDLRTGGAQVILADTTSWVIKATQTMLNNGSVILRAPSSGNLAFGAADAASPVAQTESNQNVVSGTSNTAGATKTYIASLGTSQGAPGRFHFQAGAMIAASGTTQQTAVDRLIVGATKVLTNNSATTITNVTAAAGTSTGGALRYCVEVTDGTDTQYECGSVTFGVSNKGGVFSGNTTTKFGNHQNATAGTLTVTFAISGANPALLSVNANSSLTPSTGYPRITYSLENLGQQAVAVQ